MKEFAKSFQICLVCVFSVFSKSALGVTLKEDLAITSEQRMILDKFKEMMLPQLTHDYMKQDIYLIRFLRVREFDIMEAIRLLEENLHWRKTNNMDTIQTENWNDMVKDYPYSIEGFDKQGRPLGTVSIKDWDIRRAALQGKLPRLQRYMDKMMDEISMKVVTLQAQGKDVSRWVLLTNVEGFNLVQHACTACSSLWVNFLRSYEQHFPSTANSIIAINSPDTFNLVLRLLKPSIPASSREAVKILGTNKSAWQTYLNEIISPDQRTKEYGGSRD